MEAAQKLAMKLVRGLKNWGRIQRKPCRSATFFNGIKPGSPQKPALKVCLQYTFI